jgi:hypothetical protein
MHAMDVGHSGRAIQYKDRILEEVQLELKWKGLLNAMDALAGTLH